MKKILFLALNFFMLVSLLGGCSFIQEENKNNQEAIQSEEDILVSEEDLEEEALVGNLVQNENQENSNVSFAQGNMVGNQTGENPEVGIQQEKTVDGYVLETEGNIITVDLENSGERNYPGEGLERGVEFDITNAEKEVIQAPDYLEDRECRIRTGITVSITYHVENGKNIVTKITTDNEEKGVIVYVSSGKVEELTGEIIKVHINQGDKNGETIVFYTSEITIPQEIEVNSIVTVTYYSKEDTNQALSVICN